MKEEKEICVPLLFANELTTIIRSLKVWTDLEIDNIT